MKEYKTRLTLAELTDAITNLIDVGVRKSRYEFYEEWSGAVKALLSANERPSDWTGARPSVPGWYWLRHDTIRDQVVEVYEYDDGGVKQLYVRWDWRQATRRDLLSSFAAEALWAGPVEAPAS